MRYVILTDVYPDALTAKVEARLSAGWELAGGVSVGMKDSGDTARYAQAMICREPTDRLPVSQRPPVPALGARLPPPARPPRPEPA